MGENKNFEQNSVRQLDGLVNNLHSISKDLKSEEKENFAATVDRLSLEILTVQNYLKSDELKNELIKFKQRHTESSEMVYLEGTLEKIQIHVEKLVFYLSQFLNKDEKNIVSRLKKMMSESREKDSRKDSFEDIKEDFNWTLEDYGLSKIIEGLEIINIRIKE